MRWSERQRAMLAEMGVRLWERDAAAEVLEAPARPAPTETAVRSVVPAPAAAPQFPAADWLVVGEPFDAGDPLAAPQQLLQNMLRAIGVARQAPGRERRATFFALADDGDESLRPRLRAAVEAVRPKCILALGRSAAQALFASDEPLGSLRGRAHTAFGVPVVVTCSLAFLLRHGDEKARAWADLCLAVRVVDEAPA